MIAVTLPARTLSDVQLACSLAHIRNIHLLRESPELPKLYASGVRWKREPTPPPPLHRVEQFDDPLLCIARGWGDCDDLAPWRSAELAIECGQEWRYVPFAIPTPAGAHIVVYDRNTGRIFEDPSALLGMPQ